MDSLSEQIPLVAIQFLPFVMAVVFHEYAHGFMANRCGDSTAKDEGRLTLNPLPHVDPVGTVAFPLLSMLTGVPLLFGWAKPVPINPTRFKKYRPGLFMVALAGPGMNFLLAFVSALVFWGVRVWTTEEFYLHEPLVQMALASVTVNFSLGIFNLLPIPPLDGSKMLESVLPIEAARKYENLAQYGFFIVMGLVMTGVLSILRYPILYLTELTLKGTAGIYTLLGIV